MITLAKGSDVTVLGKDGIIDIDCKYHEYTDQFANFILERGDLVIAMTAATVGKVSKIPSGRYLLNQRVGKAVITDQSVDLGFINLCIMTGEFHNYCQRTAEGGAQGNISGDQILKFLLPNLEIETQQKRL